MTLHSEILEILDMDASIQFIILHVQLQINIYYSFRSYDLEVRKFVKQQSFAVLISY